MSAEHLQHSLTQLIALRERELDRHKAELAGKEQLRQRYLNTVQRLETLNAQIGPTGNAMPTLAGNSAAYKQAVLQWAETQRQTLALHEADMAAQRATLLATARQQEAYQQLLARNELRAQGARQRAEQKSQDDLAGQVWFRGQP